MLQPLLVERPSSGACCFLLEGGQWEVLVLVLVRVMVRVALVRGQYQRHWQEVEEGQFTGLPGRERITCI